MFWKSKSKEKLNQAVSELRKEDMPPKQVELSATRVMTALEQSVPSVTVVEKETIEGCAGFRALIPAYLSKQLSPARRTLFDDHTRECVQCRKLLWQTRPTSKVTTRAPLVVSSSMVKWASAAALVLIVFAGLLQFSVIQNVLWPAPELSAIAERVDGSLMLVADGNLQPLPAGRKIAQDEVVRTTRGSKATLRLSDGSAVEMNERTELALDSRRDGPSILLHRGGVIVEAAKQREGRRLQVATDDCDVSVRGTVFAVTKGTKGSRVSVIEGEVWVQQGKEKKVLKPGQQATTNASLGQVPVQQDFSWSQNVDRHIALMRELAIFNQAIQNSLAAVPLRHTSRLLPLVPGDTIVYAAFPNLTQTVSEIHTLLKQRVKENPELSQWWQENEAKEGEMGLDEIVGRLTRAGSFLGAEIVVAVGGGQNKDAKPLVLAEVKDAAGLTAALREDIDRIASMSGDEKPAILLVNDLNAAVPDGTDAVMYIGQDLLVAVTDAAELKAVAQRLGGASEFASTRFYERLNKAYWDGVWTLFAVDMENVMAGEAPDEKPEFEKTGFGDIQHLMIENRTVSGENQTRAALSFSRDRRGMAAWLAGPAPMATLDFVSPDAFAAGCFIVKDPVVMVDEMLALAGASGQDGLSEFRTETGLDLREDIAAPLGREFLFAVDGPILPTPAWKIVVEVDDPQRLQAAIQRLVEVINQKAAAAGHPGMTLGTATSGGRNYYKLSLGILNQEADYLFVDGYMVMTSSPALLLQTLQYRETGYTLARSNTFKALLPADGQQFASAILYQNFMPVIGSLANYVPDQAAGLTSEQISGLKEAAANTPPTLIVVYGEADQITVSGRGLPGMGLVNMAILSDMGKIMKANTEGQNAFAPMHQANPGK